MPKIRVLIADDHAVLRAGLKLLVNAQADMEVVGEAADGPAAVRGARATAPHVVLLDLSMPGARFTQTIEHFGRLEPRPRVLVLTMHDDPASLLFLGGHRLLDEPIAELLRPLALADVGDHADHSDDVSAPLELQGSDRDRYRHQRATFRTEGGVGPPVLPVPGGNQGIERGLLRRRHEPAQRHADDARERRPHDVGESPVAIGDRAVPSQGHRALIHLIE